MGAYLIHTHVNPVPSLTREGQEGQTTKTYRLYEAMKSVPSLRNSAAGSAVPQLSWVMI